MNLTYAFMYVYMYVHIVQPILNLTFIIQLQSYYDRNEFLGLAGMVTLNNSETDDFNRIPTLDVSQIITQDVNDGKRFLS